MKKIKNLSVQVTYYVSYFDVEVPDDVYEQLMENSEFDGNDMETTDAFDWLRDNISEVDSLDCNYDVYDIIE